MHLTCKNRGIWTPKTKVGDRRATILNLNKCHTRSHINPRRCPYNPSLSSKVAWNRSRKILTICLTVLSLSWVYHMSNWAQLGCFWVTKLKSTTIISQISQIGPNTRHKNIINRLWIERIMAKMWEDWAGVSTSLSRIRRIWGSRKRWSKDRLRQIC